MASQTEKFILSAATAVVNYSCGPAEAQSFRTCVFSLAKMATKHLKNCKGSVVNFFISLATTGLECTFSSSLFVK